MTHLSEKQARELLGDKYPEKKHKYNAQKTVVDGITFDSQREADYYCELKLRVQAGELTKIELQPEFLLQPAFTHNGQKYRAIKYRADFRLYYKDGRVEVVDCKGYRTKEYMLKKKLLLKKHPEMWFTEEARDL
jgi:hypothetical protein